MATENVLVLTISGSSPVVVAADDPALVGEALLDWLAANPTVNEVQANVRRGTRES